jgi:hypothetical protein
MVSDKGSPSLQDSIILSSVSLTTDHTSRVVIVNTTKRAKNNSLNLMLLKTLITYSSLIIKLYRNDRDDDRPR